MNMIIAPRKNIFCMPNIGMSMPPIMGEGTSPIFVNALYAPIALPFLLAISAMYAVPMVKNNASLTPWIHLIPMSDHGLQANAYVNGIN